MSKLFRCFKTVSRIALFSIALCVSQYCAATDLIWQIHGVEGKTQENVQKRLEASRSSLGKDVNPAELERFLTEAKSNAALAMQPFGYFNPVINISYKKKQKNYLVSLFITPNARAKITKVDVKLIGPGAKANHDLIDEFNIHPGDPLSVVDYQSAKALLFNHLQARGYVQANIAEHAVLINRKTNQVEIHLTFDTKDQYFFGPVTFSDNPISGQLLTRYIPFHYGDVYSSAELLNMQDNLLKSRYFTSVVVEPQMDKIQNKHIPLTVKLIPVKAKLYLAGIGYSSDIGPRGTLGIDWRRINRFGHHMQAIIKGSPHYYDFQGQYIIPGKKPLTDSFTISTSLFHHELGQVDSKGFNAALSYSERWHGWQRTGSLKFLREISYKNDLLNHLTTWLYPELTFKKVLADNEINTKGGYHIIFSTQAATKKLISSDDFWQVHLDTKYIYTFNTKTRVLLHGEAGATWVGDINRIAPSLQFYTGGTQSVRGFGFEGLGPGRYLLQGGVELQQPIYKDWSAATFYDVGNAFNEIHKVKLQHSIGFGIVKRTAIGSINIGVAKPIGHDHKGYRFVISFGPDL